MHPYGYYGGGIFDYFCLGASLIIDGINYTIQTPFNFYLNRDYCMALTIDFENKKMYMSVNGMIQKIRSF